MKVSDPYAPFLMRSISFFFKFYQRFGHKWPLKKSDHGLQQIYYVFWWGKAPLKNSEPYDPFFMGPASFFFKIFGKIWRKMRLAPWKKGCMGPKLWEGLSSIKIHNICVAMHDLTSSEVICDQIFGKILKKMRLAPCKKGCMGPKLSGGGFPP